MVKTINTKFLRPLLLLICFALFCCLNGCGNGETTGTGTGTTTTNLGSLNLSVPSSVMFGTPATVTAILRDGNGALVKNAVVTFAASSGLVAFTPTSATALTNASGVASVTLNAASSASEGATYITASAPVTTAGTTTTINSTPVGIAVHGTPDLSSLTLSVSSSVVTFGTPVTATATLRDADGDLLQNAIVTFAASSGLVAFTPASATALTNASGVASVTLNASSIDSTGASSITASAQLDTTTTITSKPVGIAVNGASVTLGALTLGQSSISSYGTSSVSVPVLISGSPATVPISVTFTSACVSAGKATLSSPVTSNAVTGIANSTYKDNNCNSGTDLITASVIGGAHASAIITVVPPATNNIQFVSATPAIIGTQTAGAATLPKSSVVEFKVVDSSNNGKAGVLVDFSILPESAPGGITFSPASATSDADGYVTTMVTSGTVPTPLWVVATVDGTSIKSQSNTLTITTGLPTQDFFSLSVQTYNIEGWKYDGITSALTVIASDRLGNPVPDGTAINFITEGCQITPASCTTGPPNPSGTCSVNFTSAQSRPTDGRVTILAYAVGEKSFVDANGNNSYDTGETFYDLGDLYIDANENGQWDSGEQYIASSTTGSSACLTQPGATALPSSYANVPSKENTCTATWGINYVRRDAVIVLSDSSARITPTTVDMASLCSANFILTLKDKNGNPMPAETALAIANNTVYYSVNFGTAGSTSYSADVSISEGSPVINTNNYGGTPITLTVSGGSGCLSHEIDPNDPLEQYPAGTLDIVVTTPKGNITTIPVTVKSPKLTLTASSTSVATGKHSTLTATATDVFGNPIVGQTVNFTLVTNNSGGSLSSAGGTTDANGQVVTTYTAGSTAGMWDAIRARISAVGYKSAGDVYITVTP